jgi:CRISPR/Cas system CSM-associated protein Csm2 small subunit
VPKWAEVILRKPPTERTDREIMQIHAMMQGLLAYDKFTRRIQIAMCRSMRFLRYL